MVSEVLVCSVVVAVRLAVVTVVVVTVHLMNSYGSVVVEVLDRNALSSSGSGTQPCKANETVSESTPLQMLPTELMPAECTIRP
jgi:hypothetical protein